MSDLDLSQFEEAFPRLSPLQEMTDDEYWEYRQQFITDESTERVLFLGGPADYTERIVPKLGSEVIIHGAVAGEEWSVDWPGSYIYRRSLTNHGHFQYAGPTPQPEDGKPKIIVVSRG